MLWSTKSWCRATNEYRASIQKIESSVQEPKDGVQQPKRDSLVDSFLQ